MKLECKFVSSGELEDADLSSSDGITTFENKKDNPYPDRPYLVRVGGGYQAFTRRRDAKRFYSIPY